MRKAILVSVLALVILVAGFFIATRMNSQQQARLLSGLEVVTIEQGTMPFVIGARVSCFSLGRKLVRRHAFPRGYD